MSLICLSTATIFKNIFISIYFFHFQLPSLLSQMVPGVSVPVAPAPVASTGNVPTIPVLPGNSSDFMTSQGPPPIQVLQSDSEEDDADVQTVTIPFNSASSSTFLPMISIEDRWSTELEFRYIFHFLKFFD